MDPRHAFARAGEKAAEQSYVEEGFQVLARNFRTRRGEIDLIVAKEGLVVFVEVKARKDGFSGYPLLLHRQRRRLERAARVFLLGYDDWEELRFDFVLYAHGRVIRRIEGETFY